MPELTQEAGRRIDAILDGAVRDGRAALYEHEVYGILSSLGLTVPRFLFVRDIAEVGEEALRRIGNTLIVKIVSPEIPHKQKLGGVRKVAGADTLYVQYVLSRMREEVLSHFPARRAAAHRGFPRRRVHPSHAGHRLRGAHRIPGGYRLRSRAHGEQGG